jgi:hypothetical protein
LTLAPNDLSEPIRVHPRARGAPGVCHEATRGHDRGEAWEVAAAHCPGCLCLWKALEVGEAEEGRDRRCGGGGSPPPAPLGAARAERPGGRGGCDL